MFNKRKLILLPILLVTIIAISINTEVAADESLTPLEDFTRQKLEDERQAEEFRRFQTESSIGNGLNKGPFLIYLCSRRHFACVNNDTIRRCETNPDMECLILKKFQNQKQCFKEQYNVMLKTNIDSFCNSKN